MPRRWPEPPPHRSHSSRSDCTWAAPACGGAPPVATSTGWIGFKCVGFPLLALAVARFGFHLAAPWLGYIVMIAAMPSPQNLFIFAQGYDTDVDLAASVVVKTTLVALLLLPIWAVVLVRT
ncbi:AEC family transporter [Nocardia tengchongensis]|uniref:AEC family transporter n=1 Tax=Nocardia tengchongensis TaxID=2055889 RepID=UPI0036B7BA66